nr:immunoglobulin light chain junction region [Macaca mulatta]MOV92391.1 immunoglobulin light chain junction region [Macaca mulatta]MOV92844.1 immunoglobulin light chain junction region [Macaca mulatta]MOV93242.1 immunoglobulin light chain junction region [Macaca mulatta]MOV93965.1 immunoglobulin light chain junction region [Macaca mulatta]
CQRYDTSPLTF